jgi:hypothetical protein
LPKDLQFRFQLKSMLMLDSTDRAQFLLLILHYLIRLNDVPCYIYLTQSIC